jgi:pimeloyl-ACP methyl ester carboxylesterase
MKEQIVIQNLLINYYWFKKEGRKTILFLHGWRSDGLAWNGVAKELENEDIAMYAIDFPGFGLSAIPDRAFSVGDYVNIVAAFIKKLGLKDIILVGHSFGGRVAIKLSATEPSLVEKVVLVDSAGLVLNQSKRNLRKSVAKILKPLFKPKFMTGMKAKIYKKMGAEDYLATPYLKETYLKTINEDLRGYLSKINLPTLIIWGDKDEETPLSFADIMNKEIKNSKKVIFEGAGHFSFLDKPKEFTNELIKFINN